MAKKTSYVYIIFAILLTIVALMLNSDMGALALAERGTNLNAFIFGITLYIIFAAVIYLLSAKFENDEILWKLYIVIAVLNFVIIGFSIILLNTLFPGILELRSSARSSARRTASGTAIPAKIRVLIDAVRNA